MAPRNRNVLAVEKRSRKGEPRTVSNFFLVEFLDATLNVLNEKCKEYIYKIALE